VEGIVDWVGQPPPKNHTPHLQPHCRLWVQCNIFWMGVPHSSHVFLPVLCPAKMLKTHTLVHFNCEGVMHSKLRHLVANLDPPTKEVLMTKFFPRVVW
jgi:hypothetical protein